MKREKLADRLVNYGDAMAAFSVVNSLAFLLAMTETEVRCSLAERASLVYSGLVAFAVVLTAIVVWCHRTEGRMRGSDGPLPEDVQSLRRTFLIVRIAVIWLANVGTIPLVQLALGDTACLAPPA